jgi:hypothetical protein
VIDGDERVVEIAAMLDGVPVTPESRANAIALLERVSGWKAAAKSGGNGAAAEMPAGRPRGRARR